MAEKSSVGFEEVAQWRQTAERWQEAEVVEMPCVGTRRLALPSTRNKACIYCNET